MDRRTVFLMSIVALVAGYSGSVITHTLPYARKALDLTEGDASLLFAITRTMSLLALLAIAFSDRGGRRFPLLVSFALLPVANLLTALVPGVVAFGLFQSITRLGVVAVAALAIVVLAEDLSPGVRAYGIGLYALFGAMGSGISLILLPVAERHDDAWRILFGLSAVGAVALPLLVRFLRETRAFVPRAKPVSFIAALRAGLGRYFWPLATIAFLVAAFSSPAFDFALERLIDDLAWDASPARWLLIVFSGIGSLGLLLGGRMADTAGRRPTTLLALILGLAGGVGLYSFSSGWLLAPSVMLASLGATMLTPAFAAHRSELFPTAVRATAGGWITNAAILGSISGFLVGWLVIPTAGLSRSITILGMGLIAAALLVLRLPETRGIDLVRRRATTRG
jgi:MFS family permease